MTQTSRTLTFTHTCLGHPVGLVGEPRRIPGGWSVDVESRHWDGSLIFWTAACCNVEPRIPGTW